MSGKLNELMENRDAILLAEIGALIHDLGKLSEEFVRSKCIEESDKNWIHHTAVIELDMHRGVKYANDIRRILKNIKININRKTIALYDFILGHHPKNWGRKEKWDKLESFEFEYPAYDKGLILLKFIIASDTFDSEEDKSYCKDPQSVCGIYKSTSFGFEEDVIIPQSLKDERVKIYKVLRDWLDSCNIREIIDKRLKILNKIKESFSKTLGETRRSANDVTLWDHSYMTASMMKALLAQYILCKYFENEDNCKEFLKEVKQADTAPKQIVLNTKPFKIFSVGWNLFEFLKQSHKIPDVIGRIRILEEIRNSIRKIVEEEYALGNSIYEDDFGIYFLIPSVLSDDDLKEVKERIFDVFNEKVGGILLPVFHLEEPNPSEEFRIGKLLTKAMENIGKYVKSHKIELIKAPTWICSWNESVRLSKEKLVCNVCGKGFYCKGDDEKICETCKDIRSKGRVKEISQTVFIDEIAWNPDEKQYENACLLIAKFDLDEWLNGRFVQSLFIREPDKYYDDLNWNSGENLPGLAGVLGKALKDKIKSNVWDEEAEKNVYNAVKSFLHDKVPIIRGNSTKTVALGVIKLIEEEIKDGKTLTDILNREKHEHFISNTAFDFEYLDNLVLSKPPSPSRLMRVWRDTTNFFSTVAKKIEAPDVVACNIRIKDFTLKGKKLVEGLAYIVKIPKLGVSGEVVCEESCEIPEYLRIITPHLSEILINNESKVLDTGIEIYHPESKGLIAIATIDCIVPAGSYKAYRTISISPTLFMAIIPASKSWEIVKMIKDEYVKNFGKVFGKLPLHVGLIYFKRKMPIFVALDSAMRFVNEFESLKGEDELYVIENPRTEDNYAILGLGHAKDWQSFKYTVRIPYKLGDGNPDYYHPYLMVSSSKDSIEIKIDESPIIQKHISKIKEGDIIKMKKYYIDFEFLDSNIRRFDIGKKRKHWLFTNSTNRPKPYLLWDIDNFERLGGLVKKLGLTTTQVMNLYELLIDKLEEWGIHKPPVELSNGTDEDKATAETFKIFVENAIKDVPLGLKVVDGESGKGKISKEDYEFLKESILNGMFFDFVDLWHTILKEKFGERGEENV
ncbi:CRISPR-associated protein Csx11 [Archaeoglobus neptunius]|uniref:CRISPR-associated protein Csx11 n=1 Tax=Archaeoglobus neptunius TaxID=2798580 RepID=UPI001928F23B|nr:CRISPR-associated protein Csx11 [Archaeoglobus neptunius]